MNNNCYLIYCHDGRVEIESFKYSDLETKIKTSHKYKNALLLDEFPKNLELTELNNSLFIIKGKLIEQLNYLSQSQNRISIDFTRKERDMLANFSFPDDDLANKAREIFGKFWKKISSGDEINLNKKDWTLLIEFFSEENISKYSNFDCDNSVGTVEDLNTMRNKIIQKLKI